MSQSNNMSAEVLVDGEPVVVPTFGEWDTILENATYHGVPVFSDNTRNSVTKLVSFVKTHSDEFGLGLYSRKMLKSWLVLPMMRLGGRLQRVQIEYIKCDHCDWEGRIANPVESTLYMGAPEESAALQLAYNLPRRRCPLCAQPLARPAIWTESCLEN
ncbi:hypothetical protein RBA41_29245 [Massilia sp. CCM 9210]|uniref:hypothetical protein n=1 Tax=Massilia scottii TaxID=3057166 RepID=UPI00279676A3|nr:hypothetical protein [Massilia sp. CCM 9210]MDQ1817400.1 hypothetical protein [Massilia sp. CCM 9210]